MPDPFFIVGNDRSGTTMLRLILDRGPDAAVPPESMFLGFFAWYAGLARGGVARVGQVQLTQPLLTLLLAALVLGEALTPVMLIAGAGVLACVVATQRARVTVRPPRTRAEPAAARLP